MIEHDADRSRASLPAKLARQARRALAMLLIVGVSGMLVAPQAMAREQAPAAKKSDGKAPAKPADEGKEQAKDTPHDTEEPYDRDLNRLSEVMGALAFLRGLCQATDAPEWRDRMNAMIDAEATTIERRERLAGAFNKGFRSFSLSYRQCTPSATAAIERYLAEGSKLSRAIAARYGG